VLAPLEFPFRILVGLRNLWFDRSRSDSSDRGAAQLPIPVLSVGNLTVGGTGKTPIIRWLGSRAQRLGCKIAVITRGYQGDELVLYRDWFGVDCVFEAPQRLDGVKLAATQGASIALIDDGYQHRQLPRDVDLVLVAAEGALRARLLPRGPYREPLKSLVRATGILLTVRTASTEKVDAWKSLLNTVAPQVPVEVVSLTLGNWSTLSGATAPAPASDVLAVTGVGEPGSFKSMLEITLRSCVELLSFPDHHPFSAQDVEEILSRRRERPVVVTAKDAVKLRSFESLHSVTRVVDLEAHVPEDGFLDNCITEFLENHRSQRPSSKDYA